MEKLLLPGMLLLICVSFEVSGQTNKQPHVLFIVADDYGFHDVGYHNSEIQTPNLDKLAGEGVKLENYYVQPICTPTRSQLMSGRYQIHTGLQHGIIWWTQPNGLSLQDPTLADKMREAGYSTHMVGKWHLGFYKNEYTPTQRGFDSFYGYLGGSEHYYSHRSCSKLIKGTCGYDLRENETLDRVNNGTYSTLLFAERAINLIDYHDQHKPLFLYLAFQAVHSPLQAPLQYVKKYSHIHDRNRRIYAGMVTCMDEAIGNITKALQEKNMLDDTILIFTTDNGGQVYEGGNNWPLRGWKASLWEGGMRGVGFVTGKRVGRQGAVSRELMHVTDWFPTLVNLVNGSLNGTRLDGYDQWQTISNGKPTARKEILHNIDPLTLAKGEPLPDAPFNNSVRAALRMGDWKLITGHPGNGSWVYPPHFSRKAELSDDPPTKNVWLFNITRDPNERNDLSDQYPDVVMEMLGRLNEYNDTAVPVKYPNPDPRSNPALFGGVWSPWEM